MRNTLAKDIDKEIRAIDGIIQKHSVELNAEYKIPLEKALECLKKAEGARATHYLNKAREYLGEAKIEAIIDEVVGC